MQANVIKALDIIDQYAGYDGGHHKQWVIAEVLRALLVTDEAYAIWVAEYCDGEDGLDTYEWDEGIAP